jgi:predicted nuclease of predicted toxin-antitoxin system
LKFLIDECLHTNLVRVARIRGLEAHHVNWLGLAGEADWKLMARIIDENSLSSRTMPATFANCMRLRCCTLA